MIVKANLCLHYIVISVGWADKRRSTANKKIIGGRMSVFYVAVKLWEDQSFVSEGEKLRVEPLYMSFA